MRITRTERGEREAVAATLPLSVPARRLLKLIVATTTIHELILHVRLGEIGRHLRELERHALIVSTNEDVRTHLGGQVDDGLVNTAIPDVSLFPMLSPPLVALIKTQAISLVEQQLDGQGLLLGEDIAAAESYEALLVALGAAQRALFDFGGKPAADEFFEAAVQPLLNE
jgi:hypothetical protein